ncbi:hypothetical protein [Thiocapsa sp. N5-Cardenillas]|uniref:hypothetical protein n=1 Tax=Thiocapsa sp. N5-Cardenillas TaxID=3137397 RepID=UPI0035ADA3DF
MDKIEAEQWQGAWITFHPDPSQVQRCLPVPGAKLFAGEVIGTSPLPPFGPGKIPDLGLTVRGRSGKITRISLVGNYARAHPDKRTAVALCA